VITATLAFPRTIPKISTRVDLSIVTVWPDPTNGPSFWAKPRWSLVSGLDAAGEKVVTGQRRPCA
jgi:hypothetical protein